MIKEPDLPRKAGPVQEDASFPCQPIRPLVGARRRVGASLPFLTFKVGFTSKPASRTGPHNPTKYSETISENPGISDIHTGLKQNPGTHNYTLFRDYPPGQSFRTGLSSRSTGGTRADEGVDEVDRLHSPSCNRSNRRSHHL